MLLFSDKIIATGFTNDNVKALLKTIRKDATEIFR